MKNFFNGKTVIVSNINNDIILSIIKFLLEGHANVVLVLSDYNKLSKEVEELIVNDSKVICIEANFENFQGPSCIFSEAINFYGKVDILINSICFNESILNELNFEMDSKKTCFWILNFCREAVRYFVIRNSGLILNLSSIDGIFFIDSISYKKKSESTAYLTKGNEKENLKINKLSQEFQKKDVVEQAREIIHLCINLF